MKLFKRPSPVIISVPESLPQTPPSPSRTPRSLARLLKIAPQPSPKEILPLLLQIVLYYRFLLRRQTA